MPPTPAPTPSLTADQLRSLVDTSRRARKIRRSAAFARFGGWTGAMFAGLTLLCLVFSFSLSALFVGVGLAVVAWGEFAGARLLSQLDPRGPGRLAMNQVVLAFVLCFYSAWCMIQGPGKSSLTTDPQVAQMLGDMEGLDKLVYQLVYGTLFIVGLIAPGLTALYYLSRRRLLKELRESAEPSMIEAVKAA